jgi:hypothetical protein
VLVGDGGCNWCSSNYDANAGSHMNIGLTTHPSNIGLRVQGFRAVVLGKMNTSFVCEVSYRT